MYSPVCAHLPFMPVYAFLAKPHSWGERFASERSWPVAPSQAPGTAPDKRLHQLSFVAALAGSGVWGWPVPGTSQSTCRPFQSTAELMDLSDSDCDGILTYVLTVVSRCVNREVKARKFADVMWNRTCTPCPGVWMRKLLEGPIVAPDTAYQCHSVSRRTGSANFPALLATLTSLVTAEDGYSPEPACISSGIIVQMPRVIQGLELPVFCMECLGVPPTWSSKAWRTPLLTTESSFSTSHCAKLGQVLDVAQYMAVTDTKLWEKKGFQDGAVGLFWVM
eukprot:757188-Pelagomonas_calceolata.AAC.2